MNIGKLNTIEFIVQIELLAQHINENNIVSDGCNVYSEKDYLNKLVAETKYMIGYGEWLIGLEDTLENLFEINYKLNNEILKYAEIALESMAEGSKKQSLIYHLKR